MTEKQDIKLGHTAEDDNSMHWRAVKILAIVFGAFVLVSVGINKLILHTTPMDGEVVTGESVWQPLAHLVSFGDGLFVAGKAFVIASIMLMLFFRHTCGRWLKSDEMDQGWIDMPAQTKTMVTIGAVVVVAAALIMSNGA